VRDTFIALLFISSIVVSYAFLKRNGYLINSVERFQQAQISNRHTQPLSGRRKGVKQNGETANSYHYRQDPQSEQAQGSPIDAVETEGLPSIYEGTGVAQARKSSKPNPVAETSEPKEASRAGRPAIPGVPVEAFVQYRRKNFTLPEVVGQEPEGLRVFVQCLELKEKGPKYMGVRECEKMLANRPQPHVPLY